MKVSWAVENPIWYQCYRSLNRWCSKCAQIDEVNSSLPMLSNPSPASSKRGNMADLITHLQAYHKNFPDMRAPVHQCVYTELSWSPVEGRTQYKHLRAWPVLKQSQWGSRVRPQYRTFSLTPTSNSQEHDRGIIKLILHQASSFSSPNSDSNLDKCSSGN